MTSYIIGVLFGGAGRGFLPRKSPPDCLLSEGNNLFSKTEFDRHPAFVRGTTNSGRSVPAGPVVTNKRNGKKMKISEKQGQMTESYDDILDLLDRRGLLKERLPYTPALLEEAVFLAYKMRLITQGGVKKHLGLDREGLRKIINEWNSGDEGNCACRMARNPFAAED